MVTIHIIFLFGNCQDLNSFFQFQEHVTVLKQTQFSVTIKQLLQQGVTTTVVKNRKKNSRKLIKIYKQYTLDYAGNGEEGGHR